MVLQELLEETVDLVLPLEVQEINWSDITQLVELAEPLIPLAEAEVAVALQREMAGLVAMPPSTEEMALRLLQTAALVVAVVVEHRAEVLVVMARLVVPAMR